MFGEMLPADRMLQCERDRERDVVGVEVETITMMDFSPASLGQK